MNALQDGWLNINCFNFILNFLKWADVEHRKVYDFFFTFSLAIQRPTLAELESS